MRGLSSMAAANQYPRDTFMAEFNGRFGVPAAEVGTAFVAYAGPDLADTLCVQEDRQVGRDNRVAKDEVDSLTPSKMSLMPDNVVSQISYDQFIDLLAFLKSKKEQEALRGLVVDATIAGPFPGDVKSPAAEPLSSAQWKPLTAEPNGKLDLKAAFVVTTTPAIAVYVRAYVFAPKKQTVTVAIESENPWRAWVNGATADPTAAFEAELKEGWNVVLVKVGNGGKPPALGVRVTGDGLRTAAAPEAPVVKRHWWPLIRAR